MVLGLLLGMKIMRSREKSRERKFINARESLEKEQAIQKANRVRLLYSAAGVSSEEGTPLAQMNYEISQVTNKYDIERLRGKLDRQAKDDALIAEVSVGLVKMMAGAV